MYEVHITEPAEHDIEGAYIWWRDNRSAEQAERWLESVYQAIATLEQMPHRCPVAEERNLGAGDFRQLLFGVGRRYTHRIVFAIEGQKVVVLRIRHIAQQGLEADELW